MIFFLIFTAVIALILQRVTTKRSFNAVTGDHRPNKQIVEPDETFAIDVTIRNKGRGFIPFLRVKERLDTAFEPKDGKYRVSMEQGGLKYVDFTTWLRPRQCLEYSIPATITKRGRYVLRDMIVYNGDFLGLHEESRTFGHFNEIVVPPRPLASLKLDALFGSFMGEMSVNRFILEDPILTLGYREYSGREPMKMISWKQSTRGKGLMVKKSDYTQEPSVAVVLNVDTPLRKKETLLESCFSIARTICDQLEANGIQYTFSTNAMIAGKGDVIVGDVREGIGTRHYSGILEMLGRATHYAAFSLEQLLEKETLRQFASGRILITPDDEVGPSRAHSRLQAATAGRVLVIRASEVVE